MGHGPGEQGNCMVAWEQFPSLVYLAIIKSRKSGKGVPSESAITFCLKAGATQAMFSSRFFKIVNKLWWLHARQIF